jgi:hypothetical protein
VVYRCTCELDKQDCSRDIVLWVSIMREALLQTIWLIPPYHQPDYIMRGVVFASKLVGPPG